MKEKNLNLIPLTKDEQGRFTGGFVKLTNAPTNEDGIYNGNCSDNSGLLNSNCSCSKCDDTTESEPGEPEV